MNKIIKILITIFVIGNTISLAYSQTYGWVKLNLDAISGDPFFHGLYFTSADTGWITSDLETIFSTDDGGMTFSLQPTAFGNANAVHMLDANNGYSGGQGGWVYKTIDGGNNWNIYNTMGSEILDISFPPGTNPNNPVGYACGGNGQVWRIDSTLTNLNTGLATTLSGISAPSVNNVWFCGGNLIYYYNGTTFNSQSHPSGTFNHIHFISYQEGWVVGNAGVIGYTSNGGVSWAPQTNPDTNQRSLYGVFAINSNEAWAVGNQGLILHTSNAGITWNIEGAGLTSNDIHQVFFTSPTNGYVTGAHKTILKYTQLSDVKENELLSGINVYPNPTNGSFQIEFTSSKHTDARIGIVNLLGAKVWEKDIIIRPGKNNLNINSGLDIAGIYFLRISDKETQITHKIIFQ